MKETFKDGMMKNYFLSIFLMISCIAVTTACVKKPVVPEPEQPPVIEDADYEIPEYEEAEDWFFEEFVLPRNIIVPYTKEYLSLGQETRLTVFLDNADDGDEVYFAFSKEPGKNCIEVEAEYNAALIKAVGAGEQYLLIEHPGAIEGRVIVYDVLPASPPVAPEIDVSESPMILRKDETRPLRMTLLNGSARDREKFGFQVVENAYAIEVKQNGNILHVTGIAPGAGKIRITNPAALRDYDVMVIVD